MDPIPLNNTIFFISENGEITKSNNFQDFSIRSGLLWMKKVDHFPLFGICEDKWIPLISEYEEEIELFGIFNNINELINNFFFSFEINITLFL